MYPFTTEYNALYRQHGIVIRHAAVAGGAQREGQFRDMVHGTCCIVIARNESEH